MSEGEKEVRDEAAAVPNDEFSMALVRAYLLSHGMKDVVRVMDAETPEVTATRIPLPPALAWRWRRRARASCPTVKYALG